jgi:sec-independent protein translocase protein TatC
MLGDIKERLAPYLPELIEIRKRALKCLYALIIVALPLLIYSRELYGLISQSLLKSLPPNAMLIATQVASPFTAPIKLSLFVTILLLCPFFLYHLWAFVAPGLYKKERQTILPLLLTSTALFYAGVLFAHFLVCPITLIFFHQIAPPGVTVMTDIGHFLDFLIMMYLAFGIAFQVPIITMVLCKVGLTSPEKLKKHRPYIVLGAFIIGMLLTPPDVISQCMLAIPMLFLFEAGLLLTKWTTKAFS